MPLRWGCWDAGLRLRRLLCQMSVVSPCPVPTRANQPPLTRTIGHPLSRDEAQASEHKLPLPVVGSFPTCPLQALLGPAPDQQSLSFNRRRPAGSRSGEPLGDSLSTEIGISSEPHSRSRSSPSPSAHWPRLPSSVSGRILCSVFGKSGAFAYRLHYTFHSVLANNHFQYLR